jgi:hypothetical protein
MVGPGDIQYIYTKVDQYSCLKLGFEQHMVVIEKRVGDPSFEYLVRFNEGYLDSRLKGICEMTPLACSLLSSSFRRNGFTRMLNNGVQYLSPYEKHYGRKECFTRRFS